MGVEGFLGKSRVVILDEARHEGICRLDARDPSSRSSLTSRSCRVRCARSTRPLAAGYWRNTVNIKLVERPSELRVSGPINGTAVVDPEDAELIAVEGQRLAIVLKVLARGFEVRKGRLHARERTTIKRLVASST